MPITMDVHVARAYLTIVAEPPAPNLEELVTEVGPIAAATAILDGNVPLNVRAEIKGNVPVHRAEEALETATRIGGRLIVPKDDEWPVERLAGLAQPPANSHSKHTLSMPFALWARGHGQLDALVARSASVIGSRAASAYGETVAADLGYRLATNKISVVSGAAYGIDGAVLRGALGVHGHTVAVLACGVDIPYPIGHTTLLEQILERGLIVSEYAPGTPPARARFLVRNRLVAALGGITVVVEAGERSGSRHTAVIATRLDRTIYAFPGPITSIQSRGTHALIRDGIARLAGDHADIAAAAKRAAIMTNPDDTTERAEAGGPTVTASDQAD